jgi:ubiquinone/menaquinone biosynthesis C-methylase UbiE
MLAMPHLLSHCPNLTKITDEVLAAWPEHTEFLATRFANCDDHSLSLSEEIAGLVLKLSGVELPAYCTGYRGMCAALIEEDLFFRRNGRYRLSSFADVFEKIYSNREYMGNYLKGILLSQVLWSNQAQACRFYVDRFLTKIPPTADYLEIGPGHGLLMYFASRALTSGTLTGWDASQSSIDLTRETLRTMNVDRPWRLVLTDILEPPSVAESFDAVVLSEVLEHLDRPDAALETVHRILSDGGLAFFNVPVCSPAPDHIYLWRSPEEVEDLVRSCGFLILDSEAAPTTGYDLERAKRRRVSINSLLVARRS